MSEQFNWGDTSAIIVGRLDHFLSIPCWFDGIGKEDIHPTLYDSINLANDYRTDRLKNYHAFDALYRGAWLTQNISSVIGHLVTTKTSELHIIDGYPGVFLETLNNKFISVYESILDVKPPALFLNRLYSFQVKTERKFKNQLSAAKALAKETNRELFVLGERSFTECLPEMTGYHESVRDHHKAEQRKLRDQSLIGEPGSPIGIDSILNDDDDGGTVQ